MQAETPPPDALAFVTEPQSAVHDLPCGPPPPDTTRAARWYTSIRFPRQPVCPVCAEVLDPVDLASYRTIAMHPACAARARAAGWPSPLNLEDVLAPNDCMLSTGIVWYAPRDLRPEPAIARCIRISRDNGREL